jgi:uncharacterized protein
MNSDHGAMAVDIETIDTVMWLPQDSPGAEICSLDRAVNGWILHGTVLSMFDSHPAKSSYRVACDSSWRTREVHVSVEWPGFTRELVLVADGTGTWLQDGVPAPALNGCIDVDLEVSPSTNTLPIQREQLIEGQAIELVAAWVRFPALTVEPLVQRYTCLGARRYRYESGDGTFTSAIETDAHSLVTRYGAYWMRAG